MSSTQRAIVEAAPRHAWFPGWTMVGMSAVAHFMSGPGQSYSIAPLKDPMQESLGLSDTAFALPYGVATVISGLLLTFTGSLIDRFGARRTIPVIATLLALACGIMSRVNSTADLYVGFTLIRCIGQGALSLAAMWIVGEWFFRRRGLATSISNLGGAVSVMVLPLFNRWMIQHYDWRTAWLALGGLVFVGLAFPAWWLIRDRPEEMGLWPDGDDYPHESAPKSGFSALASSGWTLREAVVDLAFWKVCAVLCTSALVGTGLVFHQVSLLGSRGVSANAAVGMISLQAGLATLVGVYMGWLSDRWPYQRMLAVAMASLCFSVVWIGCLPRPWMVIFVAVALGLHGSILRSAGSVVWTNLYGRKQQGAVRGAALSIVIMAAAVGPLPLALARDYWQSYNAALWLFALLPVLSGLWVLSARPYH